MARTLAQFAQTYAQEVEKRSRLGIPPLPLGEEAVGVVTEALMEEELDPSLLQVHGKQSTVESLLYLLGERVPPGVYPAARVKAEFLGRIAKGEGESKYLTPADAVRLLGQMGGGYNIDPLIAVLALGGELGEKAASALASLILVGRSDFGRIAELARGGSECARRLIGSWAAGEWFEKGTRMERVQKRVAIRTTGEINTDFLSPAQEAATRDDIPLHALKILSTSPNDADFLARREKLLAKGLPLVFVGDVVGTGSSRKSASNSLVWWIGEDIPHVPNKRRGGVILASKIAPIFFNTIRGCGAIPIRTSTGEIREGDVLTIDFSKGEVSSERGETLTHFELSPPSLLDEARAGGRNNLIIGRKLSAMAQGEARALGVDWNEPRFSVSVSSKPPGPRASTLAQKLVGKAAGRGSVAPGEYVEPKAHLVFSQDTTGLMTQQEVQELAALSFSAPTIQSFCHTAAGPRSKDSLMQLELGMFVAKMGGIDLRPGDGVIHTNGNRFLLPYFVGTGGDSHTRFPIGISFPAGSDLVAFAATQGYFPLDMPESILVRFRGKPRPEITVRDLVNAIPYAALQSGKLNLGKGDAKRNVFADRILEIVGLEGLTVEESFKLTNASAERSAAASTFSHDLDKVIAHVENNLRFLKNNFSRRHTARVVREIVGQMEEWLRNPKIELADEGAVYAEEIEVDMDTLDEPLLAAPNDPDKIVPLSAVAGTKIDEVFIGSCMVDITDFRAAGAILEGERVVHRIKLWAVPPDRESNSRLGHEGVLSALADAGANIHVPGCSLCMGNQAQVATGATVLSTSTRNFENRMGLGAKVFLGSAHVAAICAILGRIPTPDEYNRIFQEKVQPKLEAIREPLRF